jgi:predicted dehydrogenase
MPQPKLRWGILGAAKIALNKVIPAMRSCANAEVVALASRDPEKAGRWARELEIPRAYGSYQELLADAGIDAVYIPLPNHLHVPWSIRAAEAGKHVLCEKPIGLSVAECQALMGVRDRTGVRIGEAFMIRTHPQWRRARDLVRNGAVGELRAVYCSFSYCNTDPGNIRNVAAFGGGALMDIGCYGIQAARFLFGAEPLEATAVMDRDPAFGTDRMTSAVLRFPSGHGTFTCATQVAWHQQVQILGETGRIEIEVPFNPLPDRPSRIAIMRGANPREVEEFEPCDQFTIQADLFSHAVLNQEEVPTPLGDSVKNMAALEAVAEAARTGRSVPVGATPRLAKHPLPLGNQR